MARGRKVDTRSARQMKLVMQFQRKEAVMDALCEGIVKGREHWTKTYDIARTVLTELEKAGFHIIPKPTRKDQ